MTRPKTLPEIKPCPFCGRKPKVTMPDYDWDYWVIRCFKRGLYTGLHHQVEFNAKTKRGVILAWNRRAK